VAIEHSTANERRALGAADPLLDAWSFRLFPTSNTKNERGTDRELPHRHTSG
jgi:hypothetical protein